MNDMRAILRERTPPLADRLLKPLLDFLLTARHSSGGDLDLNIILLAIALRTVNHPDFAKLSEQERLDMDAIFPTLGINARSISESTGIARETTRRKVAELVRKGWVVRRGSNLHFTPKGFADLTIFRQAREQLAVDYYELVRAVIADLSREES